LVAEMGTRPEQFRDAHHLASWVALCPRNHDSGGKRHSGKIRKGNPWLRAALSEAAWAASKTNHTYLSAQFRRVAARRGNKRAIVALAHSIAVIAYHMLQRNQPYRELAPTISTRSNQNTLRSASSSAYRNWDMKCH